MKIKRIETWVEHFPLTRPYTIAYRSIDAVDNVIVRLESDDGRVGMGAGSPAEFVTGESATACRDAISSGALAWLEGRDVRTLPGLCRRLGETLADTPAARAAVDIALHDLFAQYLLLPLADVLGRVHESLPTSITIGILPVDETLAAAREYVARGFDVLKVKCGHDLEEDLERLRRLREELGREVTIRVDPNQGYTSDDVLSFSRGTADLDIEFLEQPMQAEHIAELRALPEEIRRRIAADETLLDERDALSLADSPRACGIYNIKLMKCGGIHAALRIASIAEAAGIELMWGCMDESIISIAAALHAAFASPATRYLDLDGSLDLARDIVGGGFVLDRGCMRTTDRPGLGVWPLG